MDGAGLLQRRVRVRVPPPQSLLQAPNADHGPQFPLTLKTVKYFLNKLAKFICYTMCARDCDPYKCELENTNVHQQTQMHVCKVRRACQQN